MAHRRTGRNDASPDYRDASVRVGLAIDEMFERAGGVQPACDEVEANMEDALDDLS